MSDFANWIREKTKERQEQLFRQGFWQGYWEGFWEAFNQAYADTRAGLPELRLGSEFNNLCRLGLTYENPAYVEPPPVHYSSARRQRQAAQYGPIRQHFRRLFRLLKGQHLL